MKSAHSAQQHPIEAGTAMQQLTGYQRQQCTRASDEAMVLIVDDDAMLRGAWRTSSDQSGCASHCSHPLPNC